MLSGTLMAFDAPYEGSMLYIVCHGFILMTSIQFKHSRSLIYGPCLKHGSISELSLNVCTTLIFLKKATRSVKLLSTLGLVRGTIPTKTGRLTISFFPL